MDNFVDWLYEESRQPRDSVVVARTIFFSYIPSLGGRAVDSLAMDVLPSFLSLTSERFKKQIAIREKAESVAARPNPPPFPVWIGMLSVLGSIPEAEVKEVFRDWATVQKLELAGDFRKRLAGWCASHNLEAEWCYDLALKILAGWMLDRQVMWLGQFDNISLIDELTASWIKICRTEQTGWDWKRLPLTAAACDVRPFRLPYKKQKSFRAPGWRFLVEEKTPWVVSTSRRFDRYMAKRTLANDPPSPGTRGRFKKALAAYLKEAEGRKMEAISTYGLVQPPQSYKGKDIHINMKWLIRFQVPECETYERISNGADQDAIRKRIQRTAKFIGLPLRSRKIKRHRKDPVPIRVNQVNQEIHTRQSDRRSLNLT